MSQPLGKPQPWGHDDLLGHRFGHLEVVEKLGSDGKSVSWVARCDCGNYTTRTSAIVKRLTFCGNGCPLYRAYRSSRPRNTKHGLCDHPAYSTWNSMRCRCYRPSHTSWRNYGARGVTVCPEWKDSFIAFWADMGPTYQPGMELDRIDNNSNYCKSNCRWVTRADNCRNTRRSLNIIHPWLPSDFRERAAAAGIGDTTISHRIRKGVRDLTELFAPPRANQSMCVSSGLTKTQIREMCRTLGLTRRALNYRLGAGWSLERALTEPKGGKQRLVSADQVQEAAKLGLTRKHIERRVRRGWSLERALNEPPRPPHTK